MNVGRKTPPYLERHLRHTVRTAYETFEKAREAVRDSGETYGDKIDGLMILHARCIDAEKRLATYLSENHPDRLDVDLDVMTEGFQKI